MASRDQTMARPDRRAQIELVLFDVDGVLTDGSIVSGTSKRVRLSVA